MARLGGIFDEIIVSSNNGFNCENMLVLPDVLGAGPLAGIYQGLRCCKSEFLYVIACDMPFISVDYINFMRDRLERGGGARVYDVCAARRDDGFIEPFNALYGKSCLDAVCSALESGVYKIQPVLKKLSLCVISGGDIDAFRAGTRDCLFFNINYESDLQEAEGLLRNSAVSPIIKS
jgi:molybdopterin-guanine dinucleotide biosynthesis protein A